MLTKINSISRLKKLGLIVLVFSLFFNLLGQIGNTLNWTNIQVQAASTTFGSGQVYVEKFYLNNTSEVKTLVTAPGDYITVRIKYSNSNSASAINSTITDTLPNSTFNYISGTLKNCLLTSLNCSTLSDSLFSGNNLTVSPSAGFFGNNNNSSSGNLEFGKKRYLHSTLCSTSNSDREHFLQSINNSSIFTPSCSPVSGSSNVLNYFNLDLLGNRYIYQTVCLQASGEKESFIQGVGNANTFTPVCTSLSVTATLDSSSVLDLQNQRYLYQNVCNQPSGNKEIFIQGVGNTNGFTPSCSSLGGGATLDSSLVIDTLETNNSAGFIEYQMKSTAVEDYASLSNTDIGNYGTNATLSSTEFTSITDTTMLESIALKVFCDTINPTGGERNLNLSDAEIRAGQDFRCNYQSSICPTVFEDQNTNGMKDVSEPLISGVDVQLKSQDGNTVLATITSNNSSQCFQNLSHGRTYKVVVPLPPVGNNLTGGDTKDVYVNYRQSEIPVTFGYGFGSLVLNAPTSINFPGLTVSATPNDTTANIVPIQVIDTRLSNPGWSLSALVSNFNSSTVQADPIPVANAFFNSPETVTINDGQTGGINIGESKRITSATEAMSIFQGNQGQSKGDYSINSRVTLTVPAYIRATNYSTNYIFTII